MTEEFPATSHTIFMNSKHGFTQESPGSFKIRAALIFLKIIRQFRPTEKG